VKQIQDVIDNSLPQKFFVQRLMHFRGVHKRFSCGTFC